MALYYADIRARTMDWKVLTHEVTHVTVGASLVTVKRHAIYGQVLSVPVCPLKQSIKRGVCPT